MNLGFLYLRQMNLRYSKFIKNDSVASAAKIIFVQLV